MGKIKISNSYTKPCTSDNFGVILGIMRGRHAVSHPHGSLAHISLVGHLPYWVQEVIFQQDNDTDTPAACRVDREYFQGIIILRSEFWQATDVCRVEFLAHEVAHFYTSPAALLARDILCTDLEVHNTAAKVADRAITGALEDATSALALTFLYGGDRDG